LFPPAVYVLLQPGSSCDNYVVGSELTAKERSYTAKNPTFGCSSLIADFVGVTTDIWTLDSIQSARSKIAGFYLGCVTLFACCMLCLIASLRIAQLRIPKKRPPTRCT